MNNKKTELPIVSVGIPVYNDEKFIRKAIESVLNQTFSNFELIISDNASNDSTSTICKEFAKKDKRIKYIRQTKNINLLPNYNFVLDQAQSKYFVWLEADDFWNSNFLEKNLEILESNQNFVASIGNVEYYGKVENEQNNVASKFKNVVKNKQSLNSKFKYVHPISGTVEEKINFYLRFNRGSGIYAIYRTDILKKSTVRKPIAAWDLIIILNALRYGDLHVFDEIMMKRYSLGTSSKGIIAEFKNKQSSFPDMIIPNSTFAVWTIRNLGWKIFLKNFDWFFLLTCYGWRTILLEFLRK